MGLAGRVRQVVIRRKERFKVQGIRDHSASRSTVVAPGGACGGVSARQKRNGSIGTNTVEAQGGNLERE